MSTDGERTLAFELGGVVFSLAFTDVREVAELGELRAVPTLPSTLARVTNHRGDALPVIPASALLEVADVSGACQLLLIGGSGDEPAKMALPVDRILGVVRAPGGRPEGSGVVREQVTLDGRPVLVLDAGRLVERAEALIAQFQSGR